LTPQREIMVRSPGLFREYHAEPATTAQAKNAEGWFHTGDAGAIDWDGHLTIIDRMAYVGALKDGSPFAPRMIENKLKFLPYVKEAVAFGDGRDMVCALIDIEIAATGRWADRQGVSYTGHADLAAHEEVYALIADCIAKVNAQLASDPSLAGSQIRRFVILGKELSADDGALTRTGKLRRHVIAEQYRALVDAMYGGHADVRFGAEPDEVKIRDAKVMAPAQTRKAA
jgi:long-chain acyl-CoA synthetase